MLESNVNSGENRFWVNLWQRSLWRAADCAKPAPASVPHAGGGAGMEAVLARRGLSDVVMVRDELGKQLCVGTRLSCPFRSLVCCPLPLWSAFVLSSVLACQTWPEWDHHMRGSVKCWLSYWRPATTRDSQLRDQMLLHCFVKMKNGFGNVRLWGQLCVLSWNEKWLIIMWICWRKFRNNQYLRWV